MECVILLTLASGPLSLDFGLKKLFKVEKSLFSGVFGCLPIRPLLSSFLLSSRVVHDTDLDIAQLYSGILGLVRHLSLSACPDSGFRLRDSDCRGTRLGSRERIPVLHGLVRSRDHFGGLDLVAAHVSNRSLARSSLTEPPCASKGSPIGTILLR